MGSLSSAYSWLQNRVNSTFGSTPPPNMSLNSSSNFGTPIKIDLSDPGPLKVYNPFVSKVADNLATGVFLPSFDLISKVVDNLATGVSLSNFDLTRPTFSVPTGGHSASEVHSAPVTPAQVDYLNAELASHYGMSPETAYQEALSNTAYQRSVKDMQAAGLNPAVLFGSGKGSPADSSVSVRSPFIGRDGFSRRSSRSSSGNGKLFSPGEFYGISAAAGLVSAILSKHPTSYWIGQTVAQGAMTAMNELLRK